MKQALAPTLYEMPAPDKIILQWLRCCVALVFLMVLIGGLTRLSESGLSIVEWKLFSGTFPPLTTAAWQEAFTHYQATPEFIIENAHMNLEEFKGIFWLEYIHRLLGRVIGLAYLLPLLWFSARRMLSTRLKWQMWGVFAMVCAQGVVGWYMVKSGLVNDPRVSPYRLAFHLCLATIIAMRTYWLLKLYSSHLQQGGLSRNRAEDFSVPFQNNRRFAWVLLALMMVQMFFGAMVAGLHAGLIYNSFPLMGGQFFPPESWTLEPVIRNVFEHTATVQFIHRWLAFIVLGAVLWQWFRARDKATRRVVYVVMLQVVLGISTLLSVVAIALASAHQLTAILLVLAQIAVISSLPASNKRLSAQLQ